MFFTLRDVVGATPWLILAWSRLASASCECGYSVNATSDTEHAVFTEMLENDFLHTATDNLTENGWQAQEYNVSQENSRGPYGKQFLVDNIESNPLKDKYSWAGEAEHGGEAGLQLWVRGDHSHGYVSGSEMASLRHDILLGSFRIAMKLSGSAGTCGAFFWFYNNSQEIDMEFLSHQFNASQGAVNLVLQTPYSVNHGYNAAGGPDFMVHRLPFRPDEGFHEYRFDWLEDRVSFYVDGAWVIDMTNNIPINAGRLFMNHWSNGDPGWSYGPPEKDTSMTVSYIKAYFNSTDGERAEGYKERCGKFNPKKVCRIPNQMVAPDPEGPGGNETAKTYFFSLDKDKAPGQRTFNTTNHPFESGAMGSMIERSWGVYGTFGLALLAYAFAI